MRVAAVVPLLLCAVAVCTAQARAEVTAMKLCGREFLRAVVYTCGGSRWRRIPDDVDDTDGLSMEESSLENLRSRRSSNPDSPEFTRRDINNILTTICCQVGCRKSDLNFLC